MQKFDVIWIGTGQATGTVVPRLTAAGKSVAIIEGDRFGGSCVNYGCTPTKTLVASARAAHMAKRGADFGILNTETKVDFQRVMERQNNMRHSGSRGMEKWLSNMKGVNVFKGYGTFSSSHTVKIGDQEIEGDTIVIHAGARPRVPSIPGSDKTNWLDNAGLLDLKELPKHLIIVGGSYIGLEFGQVFRRLGSEVTILEGFDRIIGREDEDISSSVRDVLDGEGINIHTSVSVKEVSQISPERVEVSVEHKDGHKEKIQGSHLLIAVGRMPNSDRLNVGAAGIELDERGFIQVNEVMQTNISHIYAIGDINGKGAFTHTSVNDGEIFWDHYSGSGDRTLSQRIPTYAMYIDPPLGRVGMNEKEARASRKKVLMATRPMSQIARAREKDETAGIVKILVDAETEQFLGATIFGVGGDEIINLFTAFMYTGGSYKLFRRTVLVHPTVSELMPWILDDLKPLT